MRLPPLSLSAWLRYDAVMRLLPAEASRVLEIGAGLGSFGALIAETHEYVGLEPDPRSHETAVERLGGRGTVLNATVEAYESKPFDVVCAFEVLEHFEDDRSTLAGWLRHVRPGGHVLLSVPFPRDRFGPWDVRAGHYHRYDRDDIVAVMEAARLSSVETVVYGFPLGRAMEVGRNVVARVHAKTGSMEELTASSGRQYQPPPWAATATRLASAPFRVAQRPFSASRLGTGIVARGRVSSSDL
jgi:SAM-dependent methyltransferase